MRKITIHTYQYCLWLILFFIQFSTYSQHQGPKLEYSAIKKLGLNDTLIKFRVDSIINNGIRQQAFPGAQVLVAIKGDIIYHETFGYHTYDSIQKVNHDDIYDLASVTKIVGPLPALMKLYDEGKLNLDAPFSSYWPSWKNKKDKKHITLRELLAHQSGLPPYIVFLNRVIKKGKWKKRYLRKRSSRRFSRQAYHNIYVNKHFNKKVFRDIANSEMAQNKTYTYSGLASLIYPTLIEKLSGTNYEQYLQSNFYTPLGCNTLSYNPTYKKYKNVIVPTEMDTTFRKDLTKAWVHDENAALLGGVSGNAGLFGSALDLAKYMQMLLQKGYYDGKQYFKSSTVEEFTRIQYPENNNRRGLGFDKPLIGNDTLSIDEAYPAPQASSESFGHAGFTGTFVWADPKYKMIFVFLSNRVYPTRTNRNLYNLKIRPALQQVFYQALLAIPKSTNN